MSGPVDPAARDKYLLEVTAGPSYDPSTHTRIPVNSATTTSITSSLLTSYLRVRIKDYHGLPLHSPSTSSYFSHPSHTADRYSIAYSFVPRRDILGAALIHGFDYGHSIAHQLPPGFKYALKIATTLLDPGLYADAYAEEPYLYSPLLSGVFAFNVGDLVNDVSAEQQLAALAADADSDGDGSGGVVQEGATGSGADIRSSQSIPSKWKKRRKHFLSSSALKTFTFEAGRMYHADFFNPHLDFANFALRLPGFSISVARYVDEKTHHLRYVVKDREGRDGEGEVGVVVVFRLLFGEELESALRVENREGRGEKNEKIRVEDEDEKRKVEDMENEVGPEIVARAQGDEDQDHPSKAPQHLSQHPAPASPTPGPTTQSNISEAASVTSSTLASSISAVFSALGFGPASSSSSSESEGEGKSRPTSPPESSRSIEAQIDDLDNEKIEQFLQARHGNV